jgi:putative hemolysin
MDLLLMIFLTLLNGVFAMSEMAISTSRRSRLLALSEEGDARAGVAIDLMDQPTRFLSTVQIGITSIGVLNGIVGEAAFSEGVASWLMDLGLSKGPAGVTATGLVVTVITFTTIVLGELVPKRIGQLYPEPVALWVAVPMAWLSRAVAPFVRLLSASTAGMLALLRIDTTGSRTMTEEEISASLEEGVDAGVIEAYEHMMVRNVFNLDDRPLTSLMVPRGDVQWLDESFTAHAALAAASADGSAHSWYPVCRGSLDDVVGLVSLAHLLDPGTPGDAALADHLQPAAFVPETLNGMELLNQFRLRATRMVFVVDEYGVVQGLLTPMDLMEAITGELSPDSPAEAWATPRADGSWLLDGQMPVMELKDRLHIDSLPREERGHYNTVAGLWMSIAGRMARTAEAVTCEGWVFEVVDMDGRRIDKILARRADRAAPDAGATVSAITDAQANSKAGAHPS